MRFLKAAVATIVLITLTFLTSGCGGQESSAGTIASAQQSKTVGTTATSSEPAPRPSSTEATKAIRAIGGSIPIYEGADFSSDLTQRDAVNIRNQFGAKAEVYTLATDDSYAQVYHYYVMYLAQFRSYSPPPPYPPENQNWRTLQVNLNDAMQDPFVPGQALDPNGAHVILQLAETNAEPSTVIRYIVTPQGVTPPAQVAVQ
ncbi:MAG TPA: hypothetical protein VHL58_19735 [Thermoanaerobaculia bacterium]|nr:hypothetical protein [Thermoanaerobaculia bacterium]